MHILPCYMRAHKKKHFFVASMLYKLYSQKKNHVSIFTDWLICLIDWIHKAKLYQIKYLRMILCVLGELQP